MVMDAVTILHSDSWVDENVAFLSQRIYKKIESDNSILKDNVLMSQITIWTSPLCGSW